MEAEAIAIDNPDPSIIDFVEKSGLVPRGMSARFERLPGGVSSDIWLVHACMPATGHSASSVPWRSCG
jgi:hypothetical protein